MEFRKDDGHITLINIFHLPPDQADAFLDVQREQTQNYRKKRPGFIASAFHLSENKHEVVNIAQWESAAAVEETLSSDDYNKHKEALSKFDYSSEKRLYTTEVTLNEPVGIEAGRGIATSVTVLNVEKEDQPFVLGEFAEFVEWTRGRPIIEDNIGLVLWQGLDGDKVAAYAQWKDVESLQTFLEARDHKDFHKRINPKLHGADFNRYTVVAVDEA